MVRPVTLKKTATSSPARIKSYTIDEDGLRLIVKGPAGRNKVFTCANESGLYQAAVSNVIYAYANELQVTVQYASFSPKAPGRPSGTRMPHQLKALGIGDTPEFA